MEGEFPKTETLRRIGEHLLLFIHEPFAMGPLHIFAFAVSSGDWQVSPKQKSNAGKDQGSEDCSDSNTCG